MVIRGLDWDEEFPDSLEASTQQWVEQLPEAPKNNNWTPKVEIKVEIYTDGGAMTRCINKEILLDIES
ncbi:hypothetical protein ACROYT_G001096 [Oculina patagonica]